MAKRKVRKNTKKTGNDKNNGDLDEVQLEKKEDAFQDHEVERQSAAIRALRDVEIEQLRTMLRLLRSYFSKEQLQVPVLQFFKENLPNLSIAKDGKDGQYDVQWKDKDYNLSMNNADERTIHNSLLRHLSMVYPDCSAAMPSFGGFEFSNKSVKTSLFDADNLQKRSLVLEEPSDTQMLELQDGLKTPNMNNQRLSIGVTPKTLRLPKPGEMLLSVHGSPLGVYKEDNMETIQELEDG
ncbi:Hypothetical predicted protein [Olea europaea subsp. europaea]|uniref:Uncharacterized protein n=1 Tax=Olea europaea subsp. europaea TaxID=158383 RepID=A0A8S0UVC5_OLEEU|nr:Hypothetical predicted protein [Olea europaea subsp. europaea]